MASFRFPPHVLHNDTEPQWLPPPLTATESSIDILERQEHHYYSKVLRKQVLPSALDPIGYAGVRNEEKLQAQRQWLSPASATPEINLRYAPAPRGDSFWERYKPRARSSSGGVDVVDVGVDDNRDGGSKSEDAATVEKEMMGAHARRSLGDMSTDTMMDDDDDDDDEGDSKTVRNDRLYDSSGIGRQPRFSGMSMDISRASIESSFTLSSPTSRTG